ncbi:MAG: SMC-Scp complex subunit ScpB [Planctomycetota bacterium]|nr:SMC-Scp complex subunit ScpB [Planctomycetota bacterium]
MSEPEHIVTDPENETDAPAPEEAAAETETAPAEAKPKREKPSWPPPPKDRLDGAVEALLLAAGDVVRYNRIRDLLGVPSRTIVKEAIERIRARWVEAGLAVELEDVAKGVRVVTRPEYAEYVGRLKRRPQSDKLTKSLLETLSIVAYKQPVGRAEVERIRGVQAGEALRGLLERGLLKVVGRSDQPGRPLLYGTTDRFLTVFGLKDLKDLPTHGDLKRM